MHRDRIVGVIATLLGAAIAFLTATRVAVSNMPGDPGPRVFPYISAGILIVCGLILAIRKPAGEAKPFLQGVEKKRFLVIIGVIIAYVVLLWAFGFVVPTFAMVMLLCLMFGKEEKVPVWQAALYAAIITGIIYVAFVMLLHLRLPVGKLL